MDCDDFVRDSFYVVLTPLGRAEWLAAFCVFCWHVYSFYRPQRRARRYGIDAAEPAARVLVRSLIARDAALALAAAWMLNAIRIKPVFAILCIISFSTLVDAIAAARARGLRFSLDLWVFSALTACMAFQLGLVADELCRSLMDKL